ncbi:hypothetical protein KALB_6706 [Kutzneria albida DSM 43870]|uniref:Cyclodeaminase/cyclohydrolase domain-containing protein n=2 Tax=Kutzneria TaxID=43356 RepID=W5WPF1_9PSEU|nr:hypothetical protein KALB_6706 [Kutzneria albida DSM 43870]
MQFGPFTPIRVSTRSAAAPVGGNCPARCGPNLIPMRDQTIGDWLDQLASRAPAPGGGAVAAMHTAMAAGLVEMVCNLTIGKPRYAEHEPTMLGALREAGQCRAEAVELAERDAAAFTAVTTAYRLPKEDERDRAVRGERIQQALRAAAEVPLRTAEVAERVLELAGRIRRGANVNVLSDVDVAEHSARAALASAVVNVEVNLAAMTDQAARAELAAEVSRIGRVLEGVRA